MISTNSSILMTGASEGEELRVHPEHGSFLSVWEVFPGAKVEKVDELGSAHGAMMFLGSSEVWNLEFVVAEASEPGDGTVFLMESTMAELIECCP